MGRGSGLAAGLAVCVTAVLALAGCTDDGAAPTAPRTRTVTVPPSVDPATARTEVTVADGQGATVTVPELTAAQRAALEDLGTLGVPLAVGRPTDISVAGALPAGGVTITRSYPAPLGKDAQATLMFFDDANQVWRAVPSTVAKDRRSVSATVHHLSLWTDAVSTVGDAADATSDWAFDTLGKLLDVRVDPPSCEKARPGWVTGVSFIDVDKTNPLHFCAGKDPKKPDLLTVKVRVNRGYGYLVSTSADRAWSFNSGATPTAMQDAWDAVSDIDRNVTKDLPNWFGKGEYVYPGTELAIGLREDAVRSHTGPALELRPANGFAFAVGLLSQLLVNEGASYAEGTVASMVALAECARALKDVRDVAGVLVAAKDCINELDHRIAAQLAEALQKVNPAKYGPREAGKVAGKLIGKLCIVLAVGMPVGTYLADRNLAADARQVNVTAKALPTLNVMTQDGRMGPLKLGMTVAQAKAAIKASGMKDIAVAVVLRGGSGGEPMTVVDDRHGLYAGYFNGAGRLTMLFGSEATRIDGLRGMGPIAPFKAKYGSRLKFEDWWGERWAVVTFASGVRLQLHNAYTSSTPDQVGLFVLVAPGEELFFGEWS